MKFSFKMRQKNEFLKFIISRALVRKAFKGLFEEKNVLKNYLIKDVEARALGKTYLQPVLLKTLDTFFSTGELCKFEVNSLNSL